MTNSKERRLPKRLEDLASTTPFVFFIAGSIILILGLTGVTGGGLGLQATPSSEIHWISLGNLPNWLNWLTVWFGFDIAIFRGKATEFILSKTLEPLVEKTVKNIKGESLPKD